jgi:hypothetical protein
MPRACVRGIGPPCVMWFTMGSSKKDISISISRPLAPEDVAAGMFVTVHEAIAEVPSFFWCSDAAILPPHEMVRLTFKPADAGRPYKVKAVCLPYVLARSYSGRAHIFDLRRQQLVKLDDRYAKRVWDALRKRTKRPGPAGSADPAR